MANEITKITDQKTGVDHPLRDAAAQTALTGILNGQSIDSFGDVESALADKVDWESNTRTGVHNLFRIDAKTQTINGVTFTVNSKNIITVNNTATSQANFFFTDGFDLHLFAGEYIVSGIPDGAVKNSTFWMYIRNANTTRQFDIMGTAKITINEEDDFKVLIAIANGYTANNLVFKPMLRPAKDSDPTFAPFAKTNRELTEDVANIPTVSVTHTGTASSTGVRKQQITVNNVSYDVDGSAYMEQSVTLSTSQSTDVVFTNAIIADGTELTFSSSIWDLVPDDMVTTTGVCTVTLPKWTSAVTIGCRLRVR